MLNTLPEAVEEIIHKYHQQIKFKSVIDELKEISQKLHHKCGICNKNYFTFNASTCKNYCCQQSICQDCISNEMRYEYHNYIDNQEELYDMSSEETINFFKYIAENVECAGCSYMVMTEDEESIPENWEELDFEDRYGYY